VTDLLVGLAVGALAGAALLVLVCPRLVDRRARRSLAHWPDRDRRLAVRREVDGRRGAVKEQLGLEVAARLAAFPFEPADARFLGHPAHLVVFDGYTDVKDRRRAELREVVFVTMCPPGPASGGDLAAAAVVDECLASGRVRWATVRAEPEPPSGGPPGAPQPAASSTVSSAAGSASSRGSGIGWPLRTDSP
jgi:predicted Holliday junction resolvase-like endonuclease